MSFDTESESVKAIHSRKPVSGLTHGFYHYPARVSPEIARSVIQSFSVRGEWVLDPFMGGGTSIIEGLALGRKMIGIDVNALAHFVTEVRTTPLSREEEAALIEWSEISSELACGDVGWMNPPGIRNLPRPVETFVAGALEITRDLYFPRQQAFARCALLGLARWALDCRNCWVRRRRLGQQLPVLVRSMLQRLRDFATECRQAGIPKNKITNSRVLRNGSAAEVYLSEPIRSLGARPKLVITSAPYPGVHVLHHRWQYFGRKETPAAYWIANVPDGFGASFYTGGSRTPTGLQNYFETITAAFRSIQRVIALDAVVIQLVGFSDTATQLPRYLAAMDQAGFVEHHLTSRKGGRICRLVPNRKWYAKLRGDIDAASEVLLIHRVR